MERIDWLMVFPPSTCPLPPNSTCPLPPAVRPRTTGFIGDWLGTENLTNDDDASSPIRLNRQREAEGSEDGATPRQPTSLGYASARLKRVI